MPYALLLSRDLKRNIGKLRHHRDLDPGRARRRLLLARRSGVAQGRDVSISLLDIALPLALGGIFISLFVSQLGGRSLLPVNDPDLDKALHHHVH